MFRSFCFLCHWSCKAGLSLSHSLGEFFCIISLHVLTHRQKFSTALFTKEFWNPIHLSSGEWRMH